ncbi:MAG: hypothetical protein ABII10_01405 [Candidatus Paceibacterota bacterium]
MWKLKFPFFTLKLLGKLGITFVQLLFFPLKFTKLLLVNLALTICLFVLGVGLFWLPDVQPPLPAELGISIENSQDVTPIYRTIKTNQLGKTFQDYRAEVLQKTFIPQADYLNLAILAHETEQYETANKYLQLARFINPNRDFFTN